nr:Peptidase M8 domain containing protein [Haemonchus contortus]
MKRILDDFLRDVLYFFKTTLKVRRLTSLQIPSNCTGVSRKTRDRTICQGQCEKKCGVSTAPPSAHYFKCCTCELEDGKCNQGECGGRLTDVDFVLFVSVLDEYCGVPLAYAAHCLLDEITSRPVAGFLNICPDKFHGTKPHKLWEWRKVIRHELIHAFIFSKMLFQKFPGAGKSQWKGSFYIVPNVTQQYKRLDWETSKGSNELMSGMHTQVFALSRVTLALFEDSGWYKVDYDKAEDMEWGKNLGCTFATKSCLTWIKTNPTNPYPFCTIHYEARCSAARLEPLACNLLLINKTFPPPPDFLPEYDYNLENLYHDEKGQPISGYGYLTIADFCPYYMNYGHQMDVNHPGSCTATVIISHVSSFSQVFSHSSRCFSMDAAYMVYKPALNLEQRHGVGCFESICKNNLLMIRTLYSKFYPCYREGQIIHLKQVPHGYGTAELNITCPSCSELCGSQFCSADKFAKEGCSESGSTRTAIKRKTQLIGVILLIVSSYIW